MFRLRHRLKQLTEVLSLQQGSEKSNQITKDIWIILKEHVNSFVQKTEHVNWILSYVYLISSISTYLHTIVLKVKYIMH